LTRKYRARPGHGGHYAEARRHFGKAIDLAPEGVKARSLRMMAVSYVITSNIGEAAHYSGRSSTPDRRWQRRQSSAEKCGRALRFE
jgi:hypothetical protein